MFRIIDYVMALDDQTISRQKSNQSYFSTIFPLETNHWDAAMGRNPERTPFSKIVADLILSNPNYKAHIYSHLKGLAGAGTPLPASLIATCDEYLAGWAHVRRGRKHLSFEGLVERVERLLAARRDYVELKKAFESRRRSTALCDAVAPHEAALNEIRAKYFRYLSARTVANLLRLQSPD